MKIRATKNDNVKFTLTHDEAAVMMAIFSYVRLGVSDNSEVILEILNGLEPYVNREDVPVTFDYSESEGFVVNV